MRGRSSGAASVEEGLGHRIGSLRIGCAGGMGNSSRQFHRLSRGSLGLRLVGGRQRTVLKCLARGWTIGLTVGTDGIPLAQ